MFFFAPLLLAWRAYHEDGLACLPINRWASPVWV